MTVLTVEMIRRLDSLLDQKPSVDDLTKVLIDEFGLKDKMAERMVADWMNHGICPVCNGTKVVPLTDEDRKWSWNKDKDTKDCTNCGGQYQFGSPTGVVRHNSEAVPCTHQYKQVPQSGRCLTRYRCTECSDSYVIDSSD